MATVTLGFEDKLWSMADELRGNIESSEYKHVILGLVFLKYISDSFNERYEELLTNFKGMEEDVDAYRAVNVFFVPLEARWEYIKANAKDENIGNIIDNAMILIERENNSLKNVLPKNYSRPELDKSRLGEIIDRFSFEVGGKEAKSKDVLGRVYEFFLQKFGTSEGEFYTPPTIVKLLVNMIEPFKGRVYDPCCGSGGMFVQSAKFVDEHQGKIGDLSIYGQEFTATTWRLAKMNLAIRGIDANLGIRDADTFSNDQHKNLKADFIIANPPFNQKSWGFSKLKNDYRWKWGIPAEGNANYAWISHMISKLSQRGIAAFLLSSISTTSEDEIRTNIIKDDLVKVMIMLPPNLFYATPISPVIWVVSKNQNHRHGKTLFIDISKEGTIDPENKKLNLLNDEVIDLVSKLTKEHLEIGNDVQIDNLAITKTIHEIGQQNFDLTPQKYINYTAEKIEHEINLVDVKSDLKKLIKENENLLKEIYELVETLNENI